MRNQTQKPVVFHAVR